jgi:putative ABC transport system substrate-binding protein
MLLLGGTAIGAPLAARAQPKTMPAVGALSSHHVFGSGFQQGLREAGFVEGENIAIEYRGAEDEYDELPEMAADLVRRKVDVIAAFGSTEALAAKHATETIPIVALSEADPVAEGLAPAFGRPGGNVTGILTLDAELMAKRLELLSALVPTGKVFAFLVNPKAGFTPAVMRSAQDAARTKGVELRVLQAGDDDEIDAAFATLGRAKVDGLIVAGDKLLMARAVDGRVLALAARDRVPVIYPLSDIAWAGGLIAYGVNPDAARRQMGGYVGRILKGARPADMPFARADKIELFINMQSAEALGLAVPQSLLAQADQVIA